MQKLNILNNFSKILVSKRYLTIPGGNIISSLQVLNNTIKFHSAVQHDFVRYNQSQALKCWNCGTNRTILTNLKCDKCGVIQEAHDNKNYFKVFSLQEDFDIDPKALTTQYRKLQTVLHPDKFSNKSDREKSISGDYSALVNKAYNTLQTPLNRAMHMLHLHGKSIDEDQKVTDSQFLMEIMEINEQVEEANTPEQLKQLNEANKKILQKIGKEISNYFKENQVEKAKESIIKMKYYNSVSLHINGLLRERGIID